MIINITDGKTPYIGDNGNWWIGSTDTGVAATGQSSTNIAVATLTASGWDTTELTQTVSVDGVADDELKQVVTVEPMPDDLTAYEEAGIYCVSHADDELTFKADTLPTVDISVYVVLNDVAGESVSSGEVYSTEETVVGTWIDGKPIYRKMLVGLVWQTTNGSAFSELNSLAIDHLVHWYGEATFQYGGNKVMLPWPIDGEMIAIYQDASGWLYISKCPMQDVIITIEYTKTTDTATIAIPSATALMEAYEEGVNEA